MVRPARHFRSEPVGCCSFLVKYPLGCPRSKTSLSRKPRRLHTFTDSCAELMTLALPQKYGRIHFGQTVRSNSTQAICVAWKSLNAACAKHSAENIARIANCLHRALGVSEPNKPCCSSSIPAVKKSVVVGPAFAPFPNCKPHRPGITIGLPSAALSVPRNSPVSRS